MAGRSVSRLRGVAIATLFATSLLGSPGTVAVALGDIDVGRSFPVSETAINQPSVSGFENVLSANHTENVLPGDEASPAPELTFADDECDTSEAALAHAAKFRQDAGLASDPATLAATTVAAEYQCTAFGILMTAAELDHFTSVLDAQGELSALVESVSGLPTYAGAFFEGDNLTLGSTDGSIGRSFKPTRGSITVVAVDYSEAELRAVASEIARAGLADALDAGIRITRVSVNPRTNRTDVAVSTDVDRARDFFYRLYDDRVVVTFEPSGTGGGFLCTKNDCGAMGGVVIDHDDPRSGCTSGFVARAKQGDYGDWNQYFYTAGHCIRDAGGVGNPNPWYNGADTITWGTNRVQPTPFWWDCQWWAKCLATDQGLFRFGGSPPPQYNRYFIGGGTSVAINARTPYSNQIVGQFLYRQGRTSGLDSGAISDKPEFYDWSNGGITYIVYNVVSVNMVSDYGDSGSGFYRLYTSSGATYRSAYGVLSGAEVPGSRGPTYYAFWDADIDQASGSPWERWHVQPCVSVGC